MSKYNNIEDLSAALEVVEQKVEAMENNMAAFIEATVRNMIRSGHNPPHEEPGLNPEELPEGTVYLQLGDDEA